MALAVAEFQQLLTGISNDLGAKIDRIGPRLGRLTQPELLGFITDAYPALATPYLATSANATAVWYGEQPGGKAGFVATPAELAPVEQLAASGRWAMLQADPAGALKGTATRAVFGASRDTVLINAGRENVRWARHAAVTACGFCRMLATRDEQYLYKSSGVVFDKKLGAYRTKVIGKGGRTRGTQKLGDRYHDHCACVALPVRNGTFEPAPYVKQWEADYKDATRGGASGPREIALAMEKASRDRPVVAAVTPKPEPLPGLLRKTETLDPAADLALVNPRHKDSLQWQINCTRCATTIELRARGYDVTAGPRPARNRDADYASILNRWLSPDGKTAAGLVGDKGSFATVNRLGGAAASPGGQAARGFKPAAVAKAPVAGETPLGMAEVSASRVWDYLPAGAGQDGAAKAAADAAVLAWGPGARGFITVEWKKKGAHIFNVENRDGVVVYLDGQTNVMNNAAAWDRIATGSKTCRIVRSDDLTPRESGPDTKGVNEWVIPRDAKYLKAEAVRDKKKAAEASAKAAERESMRQAFMERKAAVASGAKPSTTDIMEAAREAGVTQLGDFVKGVNDAHSRSTLGRKQEERTEAYNAGVLFFRKWRTIHR